MTKTLKTIVCIMLTFVLSTSVVFAGAADTRKVSVTDMRLPFIWDGRGDASVSISKDLWNWIEPNLIVFSEFESISADGKALDGDCYAVTESDGNTVITMKEKYLKAFEDGCYHFTADFKRAVVPLRLYVVTEEVRYTDMCFAFSPWEGAGAATVTLSPKEYNVTLYADLFESLSYKGNEISSENYSISSFCDAATIMLKEEYVKSLPSGEHYFTADFANVKGVLLKLTISEPFSLGDINNDGFVNSKDARAALRASAKLDALNQTQKFAADINSDGNIRSDDARIILRIAARLDNINNYMNLK